MARPVLNIKPISLLKILLDCSKITRDPSSLLQDWLFKSFVYSVTLAICLPALANARCESPAATLESVEGTVEWSVSDDRWQQAVRGDAFCYGDKIRVLEQRAALRLANETVVRLRENSVVTLMPEDKGFWVELLQGAGHFLSRTPKQLTIKAAYLNAAIDGTEFIVAADGERNRVAVFEGEVRVFNQFGEVQLGEGTETSATATSAPDPARSIRLRDAAEWILYYPPLIIQNQADSSVSSLIDKERYAEALNQLDRQTMGAEDATLAASLALISGQPAAADKLLELALEQNPQLPEANALQALKALTAGDDQAALSQTSSLLQTAPENVSVLLAHAYALQSQGKIEEALKINRRALSRAPDNLFILARTAELELSSGNTRAARKLIDRALPQAPNHSRLNTLAGFIALNRFSNKEAQSYFRTAINSNDSEPLARLGLALALIQKGKIEEGRAEMEMAVMLDPGSSLLRSYLGKTYATQNQNDWADTQYQLAKNLDPNDPTPWFYQAHLKHEENKPGEALELITTAIEKNDNRAVYRSRMLLDSDAAARSANQINLYQTLGLLKKAQNIAYDEIVTNPLDFSSHKAVSSSLEPEKELAYLVNRTNETLISKLLMPIGAKEFNIASNTTGTIDPAWLTPTRLGTAEYSSLFAPAGLTGTFGGFAGTEETKGHEWQLQATNRNLMVSGGQYQFKTHGFSENNDFSTKITEANVHYKALEQLKLFAQLTRRMEEAGDIYFNTDSISFDRNYRYANDEDTIHIGSRFSLSKNHLMLLSTDHTESNLEQTYYPIFDSKFDNYHATIIGNFSRGSYQFGMHTERYRRSENQSEEPETLDFLELDKSETSKLYTHAYINLSSTTRFFLAINQSKRELKAFSANRDAQETNVQGGLKWSPTEAMSLTAAHWKDTTFRSPKYGSLERSSIFGVTTSDFIMAFSQTENSALSFEYSFYPLDFNIDITHRRIKPWILLNTSTITDLYFNEEKNKAALDYIISPRLTLNMSSEISKQERLSALGNSAVPKYLEHRSSKLGITSNIGNGFSVVLIAEKIDQDAEYLYGSHSDRYEHTNDGSTLGATIRWNPKMTDLNLTLHAQNLTNENISILERELFAPSGDLFPLSQTALTPPERRLLMVAQWNF